MKKFDIAAYIWPAYTGKEERAWRFWPDKIGEWESVKTSTKKFEGNDWPRKPVWGDQDEADPVVMEQQIEVFSKLKSSAQPSKSSILLGANFAVPKYVYCKYCSANVCINLFTFFTSSYKCVGSPFLPIMASWCSKNS